jgi:lipoprotein-anchoring transpeptidase ErfK/SrfK
MAICFARSLKKETILSFGLSFGILLLSYAAVGLTFSVSEASAQVTETSPVKNLPGNQTPQTDATVTPKDTTIPEQKRADEIHLVVLRSKRKVYVYRGDKQIESFPIAVGKPGWETPVGKFQVINLEKEPIFKSFKTGKIIGPGPENPLGLRWIGIWTDEKTQLGFHGTNQDELIGKAVSHGCIRMHNKDVLKLYNYVKLGTPVVVKP